MPSMDEMPATKVAENNHIMRDQNSQPGSNGNDRLTGQRTFPIV